LTTKGRKTGKIRRTPLNYSSIPGGVLCLAGFGASSDWYQNLLCHPEVEVWLPGERRWGRARPRDKASVSELRQILRDSGRLPCALAGLNPEAPDLELARATQEFRMVEIAFSQETQR
jgi:deazaflavin-dependent oxidoreductase (nitroreductase family)